MLSDKMLLQLDLKIWKTQIILVLPAMNALVRYYRLTNQDVLLIVQPLQLIWEEY